MKILINDRLRLYCLLIILLFFTSKNALTKQSENLNCSLAAFSLAAAKKAILSGKGNEREIYSVGYITKIWAVLLDDQNDLIIVGERDPSIPSMHLDDIAVAIRTADKIASRENPGVSIEPPKYDRYSPYQRVVYYGGIDHSHYGKVCFESDLLLKYLSLGYELTGIDGFPSEWDLAIDNAKAGRRIDPWGQSISRTWFYPLLIRISYKNKCATVTSITVEVKTDLEEELEIPREYLNLNASNLINILKENHEAVSVIYSRLFTQYYDEIALRFPILVQLKNLLALSGLMSEILSDSSFRDLDYWMDEYSTNNFNNPTEIPTLSRTVNGLGYSYSISGGVVGVYKIEDAWTDAVLSRKPKYLRQAVLLSRPSLDSISWVIPLDLGAPKNWGDYLLRQLQAKERKRLSDLYKEITHQNPNVKIKSSNSRPHVTPAWNPPTSGKNLFAFRGRFYFSTGGFESFSPEGRFSITGSDISVGIPMSIQWVFLNRFDLEVTVPLILRMKFEDRFRSIIFGSDQIITYSGGIENPIISNRIQLMSGILQGRWRLPTLLLENSAVVPTKVKFFDGFLSGSQYKDEFTSTAGSDKWNGSHAIRTWIPLSQILRFGASIEYQTDWRGSSVGDRLIYRGDMRVLLERQSGFTMGFHYLTSFIKEATYSYSNQGETNQFWNSQGNQFLLSFSFPTRNGVNSIYVGWYEPHDISGGEGTFLLSIDLNGTSLWDERTWF
ncbi:MAG: hypothetical protein D6830_06825 [Ignavibacteria bacterium]|nr:MAG: hypothetical protein D6830_06825 [Ignavibacteria bacterium]